MFDSSKKKTQEPIFMITLVHVRIKGWSSIQFSYVIMLISSPYENKAKNWVKNRVMISKPPNINTYQ
jgi:hypothetical protein